MIYLAEAMAISDARRHDRQSSAKAPPRQPKPSRLLEYFVIMELVCQVALLSSTLAPFRIIFRTSVFGVSLLLFLVLPGYGKHHPAARAAFFVMVILGVSILNPGVNSATVSGGGIRAVSRRIGAAILGFANPDRSPGDAAGDPAAVGVPGRQLDLRSIAGLLSPGASSSRSRPWSRAREPATWRCSISRMPTETWSIVRWA